MPDIREQAAKAAREWREKQRDPRDMFHDIGEVAVAIGYEMGHAAGYEDGAIDFAEMLLNEGALIDYGSNTGRESPMAASSRFLAVPKDTQAPATAEEAGGQDD